MKAFWTTLFVYIRFTVIDKQIWEEETTPNIAPRLIDKAIIMQML